ncbi:uncharacterized protein LOC132062436 [Lycium ferocissimum]|uniref:uncharacterized protein LOC132062436 n=1 Tax=Lycium ferocissimum TaxID=112874 RepID=UPI0028160751|nr:uncharacterized protein LOC132062436 [Lycium ferocissimum]
MNEVQDFKGCIQNCGVVDLGFIGSKFTWWNGQTGYDCIFKRLGKCLGNQALQDKYPVKTHLEADFMANPFTIFHHILKKVKAALTQWSTSTFGNIFQEIESLEDVVKVHEIQFELQPTPSDREKEFWKQKAGMQWFQDGDRNTRFFHAYVQGRRKSLQLKRIHDNNGTWMEPKEEISEEAIRFYRDQFTIEKDPTDFEILDHVT